LLTACIAVLFAITVIDADTVAEAGPRWRIAGDIPDDAAAELTAMPCALTELSALTTEARLRTLDGIAKMLDMQGARHEGVTA
jgi:hypothetical protein